MYIYICVHIYIYIYVCMYACICVCVYIYGCIYGCTYLAAYSIESMDFFPDQKIGRNFIKTQGGYISRKRLETDKTLPQMSETKWFGNNQIFLHCFTTALLLLYYCR